MPKPSRIFIRSGSRGELTDHPDAIVLMPLLNLDELYGPGPVGMNLVMQSVLDLPAGPISIRLAFI